MKPNISLTNAASSNGKSAGSLAGRHRQAFTLVERHPWRQRVGGFTLVELLVVIAIMSLLLALIVYGSRPPRDDVFKAMCDSNLKNLYLALQMYIGDNDGQCPNPSVPGQIPISLKFKEALLPYVKSEDIFWCPNDEEKSKHPGGSYAWRVTRDPKTSIAGVRLNLLRHPERVIIAGELSHGCHGHEPEMINMLYADGHVDLVTMGEFLRNIRTPLDEF